MMFIYVIAVYVSSDPGTYIVRIRLPSKTGCDTMQQVQQQPPPPQSQVQVQMSQVPRDKRAEFMRGHPLSLPILLIPWTSKIGCVLWNVSCTLLSATIVRRCCMVPDS
jgi:hypothetical protein